MNIILENIYGDFLIDFFLNFITVGILCYGIYYKRYHDKTSATSYMLFNVFVFAVISVLFKSSENISMGLGFGLFAILSIVRLRSEGLQKTEVTYFFGALSIAIINAIGLTDYTFLLLCNIIIVMGAWIIDHPKILQGVENMSLTLDHIPDGILKNSEIVEKYLGEKFNIAVISYEISSINQVRDTVKLRIHYRSL